MANKMKSNMIPEGYVPSVFPVVNYTAEEHETWQILLSRYMDMAPHFMCDEYLNWLAHMSYPKDRIPTLGEIESQMRKVSDWRLVRVHGLTPNDVFYPLLSARVFPCNDFIRARKDLEYTPSPDLFHEMVGHVPMLLDPFMQSYTHKFGVFGHYLMQHFGAEKLVPLARLYWFTAEFGLIDTPQGAKIFGAGFAPGEMAQALSDKVERRAFNVDEVVHTPYNYWEMQKTLFVIDSFEDMARQFDEWMMRFDPAEKWEMADSERTKPPVVVQTPAVITV
jgi:phenylalanine-4-hydroxylase